MLHSLADAGRMGGTAYTDGKQQVTLNDRNQCVSNAVMPTLMPTRPIGS
jgi:hypothetical protein